MTSAASSTTPSSDGALIARSEKGEVQEVEQDSHLPPLNWVYVALFVLCGTAQLFFWNSTLNVIYDVQLRFYPESPSMTSTITALNNTTNLAAVLFTVWKGGLNTKLNILAGIGLIVAEILSATFITQVKNKDASLWLLYAVVLLAGGCQGLYQGIQYAIAATMPRSYVGFVSLGNGLCGVVTFGLWMLFSQTFFKGEVGNSLWTVMIIAAVITTASTIGVHILSRKPEVSERLHRLVELQAAEKNNPDAPTYMQIFKQVWPMCLCVFGTFFISLLLFPNFGPLGWATSKPGDASQVNVIMGLFQVGDFVGRSIPSIPHTLLNPMLIYILSAARVSFVPLFIIMWKHSNVELWRNYGVQAVMMLAFAISSGYYGTLAMIHGPNFLTGPLEKYRGKGGSMCLVGLVSGITVGLWTAKLALL